MALGISSSVLVTEPTDKFLERLTAVAKALDGFGFSVADAAVLMAGRLHILSVGPQTLSLKLHMLQSFFHPYGDANYAGTLTAPASHRRDADICACKSRCCARQAPSYARWVD
jgi:hypothetical protein